MEKYKTIKYCRLCASSYIVEVIDFGKTSLANSYLSKETEKEDKFPLTLARCLDCGHIQIKESVNPKILFSNYFYKSSDSKYLINYFKDYAKQVSDKFKNKKISKTLEIGSNCGLLLEELNNLNFSQKLIGVDPASNIVPKSHNNIYYYNDFFGSEVANKIISEHGKCDIIIANNVFAHIENIDSITQGVKESLTENGVFIFENAYGLSTIKGLFFDQIYHEHLQYFSIKPLREYFKRFKLEIFDVDFNANQGGSIRCFVKHREPKSNKIKKSVQKFINEEESFGLYDGHCFVNFLSDISAIRIKVDEFINKCLKDNKTISCYGCPAKFALFSKVFNLNSKNIKYVVDDTPVKQGKYSPNSKILIVNNDYFKQNPTDYCIISAWNVAEFIVNNNKNYSGKFINIFSKEWLRKG